MKDLEDMAANLEAARKLPPASDRRAIIEQIGTLRIELAAIAAKRKLLQSAKLQLAAFVRANDSSADRPIAERIPKFTGANGKTR